MSYWKKDGSYGTGSLGHARRTSPKEVVAVQGSAVDGVELAKSGFDRMAELLAKAWWLRECLCAWAFDLQC